MRSWWILRWGFRRIPAVRALGRGEWSSEVLACRVAGLGAGAANWCVSAAAKPIDSRCFSLVSLLVASVVYCVLNSRTVGF